jgi:hypothetical protein
VDAHLPGCSRCRDEVAALASLPALLGRVSEEQIEQVAGPPEELLDSMLAAAIAERSSRGRRWLPLMAAAAAVLVTGGLLGGLLARGSSDPPVVARPSATPTVTQDAHAPTEYRSATNRRTHVSADIGIRGEEWGTAVTVQLAGAPQGARCRLYVVARDGRRDVAASWLVRYAGYSEDFYGSTMISRSDLAEFEIMTMDGRRLLTIPV